MNKICYFDFIHSIKPQANKSNFNNCNIHMHLNLYYLDCSLVYKDHMIVKVMLAIVYIESLAS